MSNEAIDLATVVEFLNRELSVRDFKDSAHNGLQIESSQKRISTIGFAVDSGLSVLEEAVRRKCELLVVHHGVMWGEVEPVVGTWAKKLTLCLTRGLSLYAAHLPLDSHLTLGNAAVIAKDVLNAENIQPEFEYHGKTIGVRATLAQPTPLEAISKLLGGCDGAINPPLVLPFGKQMISSVGIATGSATFLIPDAARLGLDLLISGEPKQQAYHTAKESSQSVICMGHYGSETFGVRALQRVLTQRFGVKTEWIHEPTGI
jgi:dinuclear metal center YbgI/SA1388 family protein